MLKIWGRANSINVMKVLWACEELGLPFERTDVGGAFGFKNKPDYLAINPNGRVPTIEDQGLVLWESNVIVRYLAYTYGNGTLFPAGPARWEAERWMDWQQTVLLAGMTTIFWQLVRTPPEKRDAAAIDAAHKQASDAWTILNSHLANHAYVAGATFTMGDIPVGALAYRWFNFFIERPELPHLKAWYERLCQRKTYGVHLTLPMT